MSTAKTKEQITNGTSVKKRSPREKIVDAVIRGIKKNNSMPWDNGRLNTGLCPINYSTGNEYRNSNRVLLYFYGNILPACSQEWVTFLQAQKKGFHVKRGEKGFPIVFYADWDTERHCYADENSDKENIKTVITYSTVFEISQCEYSPNCIKKNIPYSKCEPTPVKPRRELRSIDHPPMTEVDKLIKLFAEKTKLTLRLDKVAGSGYYSPSEHLISVANLKYYKTAAEYYSTLFHELIHSTGAALHRNQNTRFGSHEYSEEEIVAETGAMLLCMEFGIEKTMRNNSVEYLRSWSKHLQDNASWLIDGSRKAEKAVKYFFETVGYTPRFS